ncbi:unnamed protein product [Cochlearia groenlandica]
MGRRLLVCVGALFLIIVSNIPSSIALISSPEANHPYPKAISDLREAIVKGLGFKSEEVKVSGFDVRDALVGHAVSYEFDLEIDNKVLPFKLLEDVNRWEYVDLPIFQVEKPIESIDETGLVPVKTKKKFSSDVSPVLAPFQLSGPMELWIQDANNMRLSLPYDVDAGVLKKVILADGAVVTVKGARSVSLRHPVDFPLPLNQSSNGFVASGLLSLAEQLRRASANQESPLLSLRIVGPTSLETASQAPDEKLKLKRLAPGLVELSSMKKDRSSSSVSTLGNAATTTVLTPREFTTMWPITSINGSNANLLGFEKLLTSVLGPKAHKEGSFKVLKADVAAQTYVKIGFGVERKMKESDLQGLNFPEWRTKPKTMRMHFEVLAKVDGEKVIAENVMQVDPMPLEDTIAQNVISGNETMSKTPIVHPPSSPFTL